MSVVRCIESSNFHQISTHHTFSEITHSVKKAKPSSLYEARI